MAGDDLKRQTGRSDRSMSHRRQGKRRPPREDEIEELVGRIVEELAQVPGIAGPTHPRRRPHQSHSLPSGPLREASDSSKCRTARVRGNEGP